MIERPDLTGFVHARVSRSVDDILAGVDALRGLSSALERAAELPATADEEMLRDAATTVRVVAMGALSSAAALIGTAERLSTLAGVREVGRAP